MADQPFAPFADWPAVLAHAASNRPIYYQAPLDFRPVFVRCVVRRNQTIRVYPRYRPARHAFDPFTADAGHLDRFRYQVPEPERGTPDA